MCISVCILLLNGAVIFMQFLVICLDENDNDSNNRDWRINEYIISLDETLKLYMIYLSIGYVYLSSRKRNIRLNIMISFVIDFLKVLYSMYN